MICLRRDARKLRLASIGAILAVLAVFGLIALSGWHSAVIHDDDAIHVTSAEHYHGSSKQADPDAPIHLIAHAVSQWVTTAASVAAPAAAMIAAQDWAACDASLRGGIDPAALLRPPRN